MENYIDPEGMDFDSMRKAAAEDPDAVVTIGDFPEVLKEVEARLLPLLEEEERDGDEPAQG